MGEVVPLFRKAALPEPVKSSDEETESWRDRAVWLLWMAAIVAGTVFCVAMLIAGVWMFALSAYSAFMLGYGWIPMLLCLAVVAYVVRPSAAQNRPSPQEPMILYLIHSRDVPPDDHRPAA